MISSRVALVLTLSLYTLAYSSGCKKKDEAKPPLSDFKAGLTKHAKSVCKSGPIAFSDWADLLSWAWAQYDDKLGYKAPFDGGSGSYVESADRECFDLLRPPDFAGYTNVMLEQFVRDKARRAISGISTPEEEVRGLWIVRIKKQPKAADSLCQKILSPSSACMR